MLKRTKTKQIRYSPNEFDYQKLGTGGTACPVTHRNAFRAMETELVYTDVDRAIVGSTEPVESAIKLAADAELRAVFFYERRELGVLNIAAKAALRWMAQCMEWPNSIAFTSGAAAKQLSFTAGIRRHRWNFIF